ncbi:MAG: hypothetical protein F9K18_00945 [Thermoanaerobaculia bacterium]|nr:MAG: hypothetical protein F9K18_00945 [Thermoanaerobaculia bacterium]
MAHLTDSVSRWQERALEMGRCPSAVELVARHGEPSHKVPHETFEIWHYPLGVASGQLYSIHVSVWPDQRCMAYLHTAPVAGSSKRWWKWW